jgi:quinoprotein glucose dehydrogenase
LNLDGNTLLTWVNDTQRSDDARITALEMLAANDSPQLKDALGSAMNASGTPPDVYGAALGIYARSNPEEAAGALKFLFRYRMNGHVQSALNALSGVNSTNLANLLAQSLDDVASGNVPDEVRLDVIEAAAKQTDPQVRERLEVVLNHLTQSPLGKFSVAKEGGNADRGREIFLSKAETECLRCHKVVVNGQTIGGDAAPDLTGIGGRFSRDYLVAAIVDPNREFAAGYEQAVITLNGGSILAGRVLAESDESLTLEIPITGDEDFLEAASAGATEETKTVSKSDIAKRERGLSGMPEGFDQFLTPFELRDLVEFLAKQK